jgi:hypothetical protein
MRAWYYSVNIFSLFGDEIEEFSALGRLASRVELLDCFLSFFQELIVSWLLPRVGNRDAKSSAPLSIDLTRV